jgi:radical SAM superfamily enzyme YgiQ (UPF0313 family)
MRPPQCNALLIHPRFSANSFWNYRATCEVVGRRYSASPLGLITLAALLPSEWNIRLVDCNIDTLDEAQLEWADLVLTGGMMPQQRDILRLIDVAHAHGKPVVVGGPNISSTPHVYKDADFRVIGEAEEIIGDFVDAWHRGDTGGDFEAQGFPDLTKSPVPRFDLLKFEGYMHVGIQLSRGCPFTCEFCDIIELYGRKPRIKTADQMIAELDALWALGYRGHVDFVDDNLIGNKRVIKPLLVALAEWNEKRHYPFEFSTEASINLAEDDELLAMMKRANFFAIFVGIESPDTDTLISTSKRQNTRRDIAESIKKIYRAGIFVNAGFIIGFDAEKGSIAQGMIDCIEDTAIPIAMVGLLYALPNTGLYRRLAKEGRLYPDSDIAESTAVDQCTSGLNFETNRPRRDMLEDYRSVLNTIYAPDAFFARVSRMARDLDLTEHKVRRPLRELLRDGRSFFRITLHSGIRTNGVRRAFWRAVGDCLIHNPRAARTVYSQAALFIHFFPYARFMDQKLTEKIEGEEPAAPGMAATPLATAAQPSLAWHDRPARS